MNRSCGQRCCTSLLYAARKRPVPRSEPAAELGWARSSRLGLSWANGVWLEGRPQVKRRVPTFVLAV